MLRWYLIHTKPGSEALAQSNLRRQGFEVYLPLICQPMRRAGRWSERVCPLFPRYLFLQLDEGRQALKPVHSTIGVASIVRFGTRYAIVPDLVILELRSRADDRTGLLRLLDPAALPPGAAVRISGGPFAGLEGVFLRQAGRDRVVVLLELLGHDAEVRVCADVLLPSLAA